LRTGRLPGWILLFSAEEHQFYSRPLLIFQQILIHIQHLRLLPWMLQPELLVGNSPNPLKTRPSINLSAKDFVLIRDSCILQLEVVYLNGKPIHCNDIADVQHDCDGSEKESKHCIKGGRPTLPEDQSPARGAV